MGVVWHLIAGYQQVVAINTPLAVCLAKIASTSLFVVLFGLSR
ncbi:hypothetical protein DFR70_103204 [Nocardia tenerifensis]|uniref:Uncharacterized protein n=1 Tax=Nocardia tenerifensis TaxID=228006 RepID=A0A318K8Z9_9NOCA|nr:hypothetical protein DFR70_103204 [Nocardia tenerifensis]